MLSQFQCEKLLNPSSGASYKERVKEQNQTRVAAWVSICVLIFVLGLNAGFQLSKFQIKQRQEADLKTIAQIQKGLEQIKAAIPVEKSFLVRTQESVIKVP